MLLDLWHDPDNFADFPEALEWLLEEGNGVMDEFLDSMYVKLGWSPNTMSSDLLLRAAKKWHTEGGDETKVKSLVDKGIIVARNAERKMKDADGVVRLPVAYEAQEPVSRQLIEFANELGMDIDSVNIASDDLTTDKPLQTSFGLVMLCG
jgi:hypothetical protein